MQRAFLIALVACTLGGQSVWCAGDVTKLQIGVKVLDHAETLSLRLIYGVL